MLFIQQLSGLIKGLRANKDDERGFIQGVLEEIKLEIRNADMDIKSTAVLKLTYLEMLGYDISWAAFPIIETASSSKLHIKSIGYLAASQSFTPQTDVMMLLPNLLKKDFLSEPSIALTSFTNIATPELSIDLAAEISRLTTHTRPAVRQKAVAAIYVCIVTTNDFEVADLKKRLRERLKDDDQGVVSATVSAITELSSIYPMECLNFAPSLYGLLTSSTNNWMIIKVLKLFATLLPYEPRLQKKLFKPISELIENTTAVSVLYECVLTCIVGGMLSTGNLAENCLEKLTQFLNDDDHNLKYVSLLAIAKMVPTHAYLLHEYEDALLSTLEDPDTLIRLKGLEILSSMVTKENVERIMNNLFEQLLPSATSASDSLKKSSKSIPKSYTRQLARHILNICKRDHYTNIPSFSWLVNVIVQLAKIVPDDRNNPNGIDELGNELSETLLEIAVGYPQTRQYATSVMYSVLEEYVDIDNKNVGMMVDLLPAAVYISGEYAMFLENALPTIQQLTSPKFLLGRHFVMGLCIISVAKVYGLHAMLIANGWEDDERSVQVKAGEIAQLTKTTIDGLTAYQFIQDVEVKERARQLLNLLNVVYNDLTNEKNLKVEAPRSLYLVSSIYFSAAGEVEEDEEMKSFNLSEPLFVDIDNERYSDDDAIVDEDEERERRERKQLKKQQQRESETVEEREERRKRRAALKAEREANPYYIKSKKGKNREDSDEVDDIPVVKLDDDDEHTRSMTPPSALFYPKSASSSLKSTSTQNLHTQEPHAIESGSISKVVKKKKKAVK